MSIVFKKFCGILLVISVMLSVLSGCGLMQTISQYQNGETIATEAKTLDDSVDEKIMKEAFSLKLEELKDSYGIFARQQTGQMRHSEESWFTPRGVMCGTVTDLDLDGQDEMMVFYTDVSDAYQLIYNIFVSIYEYNNGTVNLADDMLFDTYINTEYKPVPVGISLSPKLWANENLIVTTQTVGENNYIICEHSSVSSAFADGQSHNFWVIKYANEEIDYVASYTQTEGGSSGFEYTGYEFEDGIETGSQLYYGTPSSNPLYNDYEDAISAYFSKYGLKVRPEYRQFDVGESIFSFVNSTEILSFTNTYEKHPDEYIFNFTANLSVNSNIEP